MALDSKLTHLRPAGNLAPRRTRRSAALALALLIPAPTLGAAAALIVAPGPVGQAVYAACKAWLLLMPLGWLVLVERGRPGVSRPRAAGMRAGLAQGLVVFSAIVGAFLLLGPTLVDAEPMRAAVSSAGLGSPRVYLAFATYLTLVNSLLEEYVWRWFAFEQLDELLGPRLAVPAAAAAFTLHHVVALAAQFDATVTALGSVGVFVGGLLWSWLYRRHRSIWPGWLSHVLADSAVLGVGWLLLFRTAQ